MSRRQSQGARHHDTPRERLVMSPIGPIWIHFYVRLVAPNAPVLQVFLSSDKVVWPGQHGARHWRFRESPVALAGGQRWFARTPAGGIRTEDGVDR